MTQNENRDPILPILGICIALFIAVLFALMCHAQSWPTPSRLPNVAVPCVTPMQTISGAPCTGQQLTAPYAPPLLFVGRYLDAQATRLLQQPIRTLTARTVRVDLARNRIYMILGGGLLAGYDLDRFVSRLAAGEALVPITILGVGNRGAFPERFLRFDRMFYAERAGWHISQVDTQDRLLDFDFDDRGNVAVAYDVFGFGLLNSDLQSLVQGDVPAKRVVLFRSGARYYMAITPSAGGNSQVYEVTVPSSPVRLADLPFAVDSFTHLSDGSVAIVDSGAHLRICTAFGLAMSLCPSSRTSRTGHFVAVDSDGTSVYAVSAGFGAAPVSAAVTVVTPTSVQEIATGLTYVSGLAIRVGGGHLALFGVEGAPLNARNLRLWRLALGSSQPLVPVPLVVGSPQPGAGQFMKNYYHINTTPGYVVPRVSGTESPGDVAIWLDGGRLLMAVNAQGLADLWAVLLGTVPAPVVPPIVTPPPAPAPAPALCPCPQPAPTPAPQPAPAPAPAPKPPCTVPCSREHRECC